MSTQNRLYKLASILFLAVLLLTACSGQAPKATEIEVVIGPEGGPENIGGEGTAAPETGAAPVPTNTLRPAPTEDLAATQTAEAMLMTTPTVTLSPYDALIVEGRQMREGMFGDAAIAKFTEAITMDSTNPVGYMQRGITYSAMGRFDEAITDFNIAINYDPQMEEAYNARGIAFTQKQSPDQALQDFNKATEINPQFVSAYTNRAINYIVSGKTDEALAEFTKAIELAPNDKEMYFNRGQAYMTIYQSTNDATLPDLCIADFSQALVFDPNYADAYSNRGLCYQAKEQFELAYNDLTQAISIKDTVYRYFLLRASLFPEFGTPEQALADAQKALELTEDEEAKKAAQEMIAKIPTLPTATPAQ